MCIIILVKEIEEDLNKLRHLPCSWIGRFNTVKISILSKLTMDSTQSESRYLQDWFFCCRCWFFFLQRQTS